MFGYIENQNTTTMELLRKGSLIKINHLNNPRICVGVNWGAIIRRKLFFGLIPIWENVDLDISVAIFDKEKQMVDLVYYDKLKSRDGAVRHSGDDHTGDKFGGDDELDNEVIEIDLSKISEDIEQLIFFLNNKSSTHQDFSTIPYSKIRIYDGEPNEIRRLYAIFNLSAQKEFAGKNTMIMGKFMKKDNEWHFISIGEGLESVKLLATASLIRERFLSIQLVALAFPFEVVQLQSQAKIFFGLLHPDTQ